MKNWRKFLGNERGNALALALIIMVAMTALAIGLAAMGGVESRISASQSAGTRARLLAESGIEYAFIQLAGVDFSTKLAAVSPGFVLIASTPLPGLTAASGTFAVTIRNDINAGDALLTGAAVDTASIPAGTATSDVNGIVVLTSTGTFDPCVNPMPSCPATRVIVAVVQRGNLSVNGAVTLPGVQADTFTESPCQNPSCPPNALSRNYSIDGRDWQRNDPASMVNGLNTTLPTGSNGLKLAIATAVGTEATVENGFSDTNRRNYVEGLKEGTGPGTGFAPALTTGLNTINGDNTLTSPIVQKFLTNLAANPATQIIQSNQACQFAASGGFHTKPEGIRMVSTATPSAVTVKNNCTGGQQINQTINLGSPTSPQMIYFKGEFDPSSNFVGVGVDGAQPIQGYGLLVVEDADLDFFQTGKFRWDGIVLVTGRNVAVAFLGNSDTEIRGVLIGNEVNPLEPGGYFEFFNKTTDTMIIRASKQNIDMALLALYNMRITSYREVCSSPPC